MRHVVRDDVATLVYLANQAAIELRSWPSTMDKPEHPDRLVIDIDPPDNTEVTTLRTMPKRLPRKEDPWSAMSKGTAPRDARAALDALG